MNRSARRTALVWLSWIVGAAYFAWQEARGIAIVMIEFLRIGGSRE